MINKTYYFLSGLPRSGSTVLSAILNQNPGIYVTPTSPMLDQLIENQNIWNNLQTVRANPVPDQLTNITKSLINAMWQHRPEEIIIDKNRGWGKNMPSSTILFEKEIKMIATIRDLPSIMASWITLLEKNPNNFLDKRILEKGFPVNTDNRTAEMWFNMVKDCMDSILQAKKDASNRLLLINYDNLVSEPLNVLNSIERFLNLPTYKYDIDNIVSVTNDNDLTAWGLRGMHTIRPKLCKTSKDPREILGDMLYNRFVELEKQYV